MNALARVTVTGLLVALAGGNAECIATEDSNLAGLLTETARVARQYRDTTLKFECQEAIQYVAREDWKPRSGFVRLAYIYERDASGTFSDCRLWTKRGRKAEAIRCVQPDEYRVPLYLSNAYLFVFAFLEERQPLHEYRIAGTATVSGRPAIVVAYGPRGAIRAGLNDWFGTAWIDRETHQILEVEAYRPQHWAAKLDLDRAREAGADTEDGADAYEVESVRVVFGERTSGLRFVSSVHLKRARYRRIRDFKEEPLIDVDQRYTRYRFFQVTAEDEIRGP